jgi:hypothetical protein
MGINFHCSQVTLRHEGLPLFLRTSSRLIEWKRTNCKMITLNKISASAGMTSLKNTNLDFKNLKTYTKSEENCQFSPIIGSI